MNKKIFGKKLSRNRGSRKALFRSLVRSLVLTGKIKTTKAKAKAIEKEISKIMKLVSKGDLASRRKVLALTANDRETTQKLFSQFASAAIKHSGGYLKKTPLLPRRGDMAPMVQIEWTTPPQKEPAQTKKEISIKKVKSQKTKETKTIKSKKSKAKKQTKKLK
jgi:large subunit ribosomal protein L17